MKISEIECSNAVEVTKFDDENSIIVADERTKPNDEIIMFKVEFIKRHVKIHLF